MLNAGAAAGPGPGDTAAGAVLLQHLEGAPWNFLTISRYGSWSDFASNESSSVAETATGASVVSSRASTSCSRMVRTGRTDSG